MTLPRFGADGRLWLWLLVPVLVWAVSGCAVLPPAAPRESLVAEDLGRSLLDGWWRAQDIPRSLEGVAKVRVETPERTASGTQVLLTESPSRLRAEVLSPFGTPVLSLAADGSNLAVLLPGDNLFYRGQATPENLGRFTRLPLRLADLVGILLARPPLIAYQGMTTYLLPGVGWRIELSAGARQQQLLFDTARRLSEVRYLSAGELQLHLVYAAPDEHQPGLPSRIELALPLQNTRASLVFTELTANRSFNNEVFVLSPSAGVKIVDLDEERATEADAGADEQPPLREAQ